jgi:hypothetical protein
VKNQYIGWKPVTRSFRSFSGITTPRTESVYLLSVLFFYSLIGLHSIMHQHNILHIHLHPLNMHVLLQPVPKLLHGPSLVDLPLSLIILLYAISNLPTKINQLMQPHTSYLVKIPSQIPNTSSNKTTLQIPTSIPSVNNLPNWKNKYRKPQPSS